MARVCLNFALHRHTDGCKAPPIRLVRSAHLPRSTTHRHRARRRHHVPDPAQPVPRGVVATVGHLARGWERSALHADHHLRDLPLPGWPLARHAGCQLLRRSSRRRHCRRRAASGRIAQLLAQPARMGGMGGMGGRTGTGLSRASGCPRRGRGECTQGAHADQPLQRPSPMAC